MFFFFIFFFLEKQVGFLHQRLVIDIIKKMPRKRKPKKEPKNAKKINELVDAMVQHKGFKQMAQFNMACLAKLVRYYLLSILSQSKKKNNYNVLKNVHSLTISLDCIMLSILFSSIYYYFTRKNVA